MSAFGHKKCWLLDPSAAKTSVFFSRWKVCGLNLVKMRGCKPKNFLLVRYLCKFTFTWGELRGEDANERNVVCLTPLQKKLQFSSQDEKYVGWTFWRWGGANLRIPFHSQFANHKYKQVKLRSASHCQWKMRSGFDTAKTKKTKVKAKASHCKSRTLQKLLTARTSKRKWKENLWKSWMKFKHAFSGPEARSLF